MPVASFFFSFSAYPFPVSLGPEAQSFLGFLTSYFPVGRAKSLDCFLRLKLTLLKAHGSISPNKPAAPSTNRKMEKSIFLKAKVYLL